MAHDSGSKLLSLVNFLQILSAKLELASEETVSRIKALLAKMQQTLGQDILAMAWNTLQPQQQAALQS